MADGLGTVGQRLSNALGRLQQSETGPSGKPAQPLQQAAAGPLKSVMVNVKAKRRRLQCVDRLMRRQRAINPRLGNACLQPWAD